MPEEQTGSLLPIIPETITVHLGAPSASAQNVSVSFPDYIKNVASSEIYPTWPDAAIRANIYAQISFALNRIYTEYYRSRGYNFDITSNTAYDQAFVNNRDIFENISFIVDDIFNSYIRREGAVEPLYAQYCNGTTTTCAGLSQWGTVGLAYDGLSAFEILQYYFGEDIELVTNVPIAGLSPSVPVLPLQLGSVSNDVALLQERLNRISVNYPTIPKIPDVNGIYDRATRDAVVEFQKTFNLEPDGITGKATWYEALRVYSAVKKLNELNSEQIKFDELPMAFPEMLSLGDAGNTVRTVQFYLDYVASYSDTVPSVPRDGYFGPDTEASVKAFQNLYSLPETGAVDDETFAALYNAYLGIIASFPENMFINSAVPFPGTALILGSEGPDVQLLQGYINTLAEVYPEIGTLTVDGIYGEATDAAVRRIQALLGLPENGITGIVTWNAIAEKYDNIRSGSQRSDGQWSPS